MKKYMPFIFILFFLLTLLSIVLYPTATPILGTIALLLTLALSTYTIYAKHKGTQHARAKILKEVGVMVFMLIAIIFLGGIAGMLANAKVSIR